MNQCFGCNTCASADKKLEGYIRELPMETSHHRVEGQSTKCRVSAAGFVQMGPAGSHLRRREESVVLRQM